MRVFTLVIDLKLQRPGINFKAAPIPYLQSGGSPSFNLTRDHFGEEEIFDAGRVAGWIWPLFHRPDVPEGDTGKIRAATKIVFSLIC